MAGKSNLFTDKEYEEMEWLEKAVEPFMFSFNEVLKKFPDVYELTSQDVLHYVNTFHYHLSKNGILSELTTNLGIVKKEIIDANLLSECFTMEVADNTIVNLQTNTINGSIRILKTKQVLEDDDIRMFLSKKMRDIIWSQNNSVTLANLNELMDILGIENKRKSKSEYNKLAVVVDHMEKVVLDDKWKIRNADLVLKLANWISDFLNTGNLASLSNVTRLKCMTYSQLPIYSIQETI